MADLYLMWKQTKTGSYVNNYIGAGFAVFPCHSIKENGNCTCGLVGCKNKGKHPACKDGFKDAVMDFEQAAELFQFREDLNIGIACGMQSGITIIDVDPRHGGDESLAKLESLLGALPHCPVVLTGGGGRHLVFDRPDMKIPNRSNAFGKEYPGLDIRNDGGYVVWPPSLHESGRHYEFSDDFFDIDFPPMPDQWKMLGSASHGVRKDKIVDRHQNSGNQSDWTPDDVWGMLEVLDPDMGYSDWISIGMALHKEGFDIDLWDRWSSRGSKYNGIGDLDFHWRSFNKSGTRTIGTIVEWATLQGWHPERRYEERVTSQAAEDTIAPLVKKMLAKSAPPAVAAPISAPEKKEKPIKESSKSKQEKTKGYVPKFGFDPMTLPGGIGETIRWITKHAIYEQPELALLNVLAFAGAVFGRRYASPVNTRTNIYMVGIARTGGGKEHSCGMITRLAMESGLSPYMGPNSIRSDIGLLKGLMTQSSQLLMIDEFGMMMQALSDRGADFNKKSIITAITKLYSKSGSAYNHGDVSDPRAAKIILAAPNLCIYGTTTEESYVPSLRRIAIVNGELNRFIVIPSRNKLIPKRRMPVMEKNEDLVNWWHDYAPSIRDKLAVTANSATTVPDPTIVEWGDCDDMQYKILMEQTAMCESEHPMRFLWSRLYENTIKIAMIFAIARDKESPKFEAIDLEYAYSIVKSSVEYMSDLSATGMAETQQESDHLEIMNAIREVGTITRRDLLRKFRKYKKREMDDIIGGLVEEESLMIERTVPATGGRPTIVYHFINDEDNNANI